MHVQVSHHYLTLVAYHRVVELDEGVLVLVVVVVCVFVEQLDELV